MWANQLANSAIQSFALSLPCRKRFPSRNMAFILFRHRRRGKLTLCLIIRSDGNQLFQGAVYQTITMGPVAMEHTDRTWQLRILLPVNMLLTRHGLVAGMCRLTPIRYLLRSRLTSTATVRLPYGPQIDLFSCC